FQVASITTPDAKTIAIQPWERNLIPKIEKAILDANVGLTPANNGEIIRCIVPALTEERRKELIKKAKSTGENSKVVVRNARRDGVDLLKKALKNEGMSEDTEKEAEEEIQKLTDKQIKRIDEIVSAKEKDIMTV
ncbi:MAG: ribosome recycling factor, partial [Bacteroidia bacterium]|nr:ribosome recycling factor [Bacteroidia bacterium]